MTTTIRERHFSVSSPEYTSGNYWGDEPPEVGCDYAWVKARTKREAKVLAVKAWGLPWKEREELSWVVDSSNGSFDYCDGRAINPFKGLKVEEIRPCHVHGFEPEGEPFVNCTSGICLPYWCHTCDTPIEPLGSEKSNPKDSVYGDDTWVHALCLMSEQNHAEAVYGEDYFA